MANSVETVLKNGKTGSWTNGDIKPPTPMDDKLRLKHVSDSVPYNTAHACDHIEEVAEQLKKLAMIDKTKTKKLAKEASARLHKDMEDICKYGGCNCKGGK